VATLLRTTCKDYGHTVYVPWYSFEGRKPNEIVMTTRASKQQSLLMRQLLRRVCKAFSRHVMLQALIQVMDRSACVGASHSRTYDLSKLFDYYVSTEIICNLILDTAACRKASLPSTKLHGVKTQKKVTLLLNCLYAICISVFDER
jgi:hypothetical protein